MNKRLALFVILVCFCLAIAMIGIARLSVSLLFVAGIGFFQSIVFATTEFHGTDGTRTKRVRIHVAVVIGSAIYAGAMSVVVGRHGFVIPFEQVAFVAIATALVMVYAFDSVHQRRLYFRILSALYFIGFVLIALISGDFGLLLISRSFAILAISCLSAAAVSRLMGGENLPDDYAVE